ncbi:MAG: Structural maintenance of chromosomes protein 3 [Claussenomyces sp. TS43310]|nr:MAG: Structural maintenance of chromosomes protein 3 [Claussenomyces sp. TS43310]
MGREERQALLHEGSGSAVMSAYVEVIFDNEDGRFPTGKDELILRRTIGLKKDEYSLDRKNATKTDVMNLLESAGFSRSNPYYIVPQGRVTTLTNMKDAERLTLLKEVAGTQVYEARRTESLKIMTETNNKRAKIDELLDYIKERLSELEEEKEELRGYQEKDKERRCLEYTFYHREQVALANALDEIEESRQDGIENTDENRQAFVALEGTIAKLDSEISKLNSQMELLKIDRRQLEEDRRESAKVRAKAELDVTTLSDGQSAAEQARQRHQQELKSVAQEIAKKEAELAKIIPDYTKARANETEVKTNLDNAEASRQRLYSKQGRNAQFKSKSERDKWLRKEIEELKNTLATQNGNRVDADEEVEAVQSDIHGLEGEIAGLRERLEGWGGNRQALSEEVASAKDALERLNEERKMLRREDDKLESVTENARHERDQAERVLSHSMDGATARGLATIRRIKREQNITGAYGTLAELLEVNEQYRTAVEQTAGNSLFQYVVDNVETATHLVNALYKQHGGRVTFMPLDQLHPRPVNYPNANDAIPLLSKIKYNSKYEKAFQQVFGKTVICPNLIIGGQYARSHALTAITPEGDTANKRGALTGGYIDSRKSRLEAVRAVDKWRDEYESHRARSQEIRTQIERKDQEYTAAMGERQKVDQRMRQLEDGYEPLRAELRSKVAHLDRQKDGLDAKLKRRDSVAAILKGLGEQIVAYQAELSSEFKKTLTRQEEEQLEELNVSVQGLKIRWNEISKTRRQLENRKNLLEVDLRENLRLKLDQLNSQDFDNTSGGSAGDLKAAQRELKRVNNAAESIEIKLQENEQELDLSKARLGKVQNERTQNLQKQDEIAKAIESFQKRMEKSIAKKALLTTSAAECAKNIRDLGVLPEEAFERFENTDSKTVTTRLKKVNEALKKYKHVNKKAFEQYNNFTTQRETLTKRRKELDLSQASIEELVSVLDQRKDEAIERTFKQVSREFAQIFERLVPAGRGRLVIQRRTDQRNDDSDDEEREAVENYTGVGISVSFNSKHDEQQRIQQLSGGQKSLCALALVFAIQQCDPAPFYLFDEIDANLDAQYRTAVAQMLQQISMQQSQASDSGEQGMSGQFICTTFRPEMVVVADKCYGVTFGGNKTSNIDVVSRDKALEFVEGQMPK